MEKYTELAFRSMCKVGWSNVFVWVGSEALFFLVFER